MLPLLYILISVSGICMGIGPSPSTAGPTSSAAPTVSYAPTFSPTAKPTKSPIAQPTFAPSFTFSPTAKPSISHTPTAVPTNTPCPISLAELNALEFLYNSTNGQNWNWTKQGAIWRFPAYVSDPSAYSWQGLKIVVSSGGGGGQCEVQQLNLQTYNLLGTIPQQISALTGLTYLRLNLNKLKGHNIKNFNSRKTPVLLLEALILEMFMSKTLKLKP